MSNISNAIYFWRRKMQFLDNITQNTHFLCWNGQFWNGSCQNRSSNMTIYENIQARRYHHHHHNVFARRILVLTGWANKILIFVFSSDISFCLFISTSLSCISSIQIWLLSLLLTFWLPIGILWNERRDEWLNLNHCTCNIYILVY